MRIRCECGWGKVISDQFRGKTAQCPACQRKFILQPVNERGLGSSPFDLAEDEDEIHFQAVEEESFSEVLSSPSGHGPSEFLTEFPAAPQAPSPDRGELPWACRHPRMMRTRVAPHYPWVAWASYILDIFARISAVLSVISLLGGSLLLLVGISLVIFGVANRQSAQLQMGLSWLMAAAPSLLGACVLCIWACLFGAASEMGLGWAAERIERQIYPHAPRS